MHLAREGLLFAPKSSLPTVLHLRKMTLPDKIHKAGLKTRVELNVSWCCIRFFSRHFRINSEQPAASSFLGHQFADLVESVRR